MKILKCVGRWFVGEQIIMMAIRGGKGLRED
jgi:hypothetical protein